jgi:uncharacterized protein (TIGR02996 family)
MKMNILTLPQSKAFLEQINTNPYDTSIRLVYADWLESIGCHKAANKQREYKKIIDEGIKLGGPGIHLHNQLWIILPNGSLRMRNAKDKKHPTKRIRRKWKRRHVQISRV